jgi:transposase
MEAVFLKNQGLSHQEICRLSGIVGHTLRGYLKEYQEGGIERLKPLHFRRPESQLMGHRGGLEEYFQKHPPASVIQARAVIKETTGIERSPTQVREFLNHIGLKRRKLGMIPAKADTEEQGRFKQDELGPRLEEAKAGKRAVFFRDAALLACSRPFWAFLGLRCVFLSTPRADTSVSMCLERSTQLPTPSSPLPTQRSFHLALTPLWMKDTYARRCHPRSL